MAGVRLLEGAVSEKGLFLFSPQTEVPERELTTHLHLLLGFELRGCGLNAQCTS
jgi:hypothetical protein